MRRLITDLVLEHFTRDENVGSVAWCTSSPMTRMPEVGRRLAAARAFVEVLDIVDEEIRDPCPVFDQGASVVGSPSLSILAKVAAERLHSPRAIYGRGYGSECRYGLETTRISKRNGQRAVTAHGVTHNALSRHISGKFRLD